MVIIHGQGHFFEQLNESSVVFLALLLGETASPECNGGECRGSKTSPRAKALENKGLKCGSEKKCPLPVNGSKCGSDKGV
jgi:hypothetical protein